MRGSSAQAYTPPPLTGERFAGANHEGGAADSQILNVRAEKLFRRRASVAEM